MLTIFVYGDIREEQGILFPLSKNFSNAGASATWPTCFTTASSPTRTATPPAGP